ncbi:hypothetical protein IAT40_005339 [Kwoniella sp. CBS 6097]
MTVPVQASIGHRRHPSPTASTGISMHAERYDPYPSVSRRSTNQPGHLLTTQPLAPYSHSSMQSSTARPAEPDRRSKAYESARPKGRYQPSRGAQRDAKYSRKLTAAAQATAETSRGQTKGLSKRNSSSTSCAEVKYEQTKVTLVHPTSKPNNQPVHTRPTYTRCPLSDEVLMEQIRKEQIAAVQAARKEHQEMLALRAKKEEEDKKVRRIQLQVFVHARPTHCEWDDCQAVLNSWALLEKHLHHAHLHPRHQIPSPSSSTGTDTGQTCCHWQGCSEAFATREECYKHALTGHMGNFAARCPFNCLFQGPSFSSLMAHISRRHPNATPDDFVPGLIHFPPPIPPLSSLPQLPQPISHEVVHWLKPVLPHDEGIGHRNRKMVIRNCLKGRYPRVDAYKDKRGAGAAIKAIIENAKRLKHIPPQSAVSVKIEGEEDLDNVAEHLDEEEPGTARTVIELVDVQKSARSATDAAKMEIPSPTPRCDISIPNSSSYGSNDSGHSTPIAAGSRKRRKGSISFSDRSTSTSVSSKSHESGESNNRASGIASAVSYSPREERMLRRRLRLRIGDRKSQSTEIQTP